MYIGHVDHWHNFSKNGLNPFVDKANLKFCGHLQNLVMPPHVNHVNPSFAICNMAHKPNCAFVFFMPL